MDQENLAYKTIIEADIKRFLQEDIHFEDVSSSLIPANELGKATIHANQEGVIFGLVEIEILFDLLGCKVVPLKADGSRIMRGDKVITISGPLRSILLGERTALNLLMHLSGVATATRTFQDIIDKVKTNPRCRIAATRKTIPGLRIMEKRAVKIAGGETHRWNLDDMVLLKDTHRAFFNNIEEMVKKYKEITSFTKKIEVEVESVEDALVAARAGADIIMFDNMSRDDMTRGVKALNDAGLRDRVIIESSGNVSLETVSDHASTGVDLISTSAITLRALTVDFSLELGT